MSDLFVTARNDMLLDQERDAIEARVAETIANKKAWGKQQHTDYLVAGTRSDKCMNYPIMQRKLVCSRAFLALSPVASKMLILCYNETYWEPPTTDKRRINKHVPFSPGEPKSFVLPYDRCRAAGISSYSKIKQGFNELIALKFIKLETPARKGTANIYRVSEGYLKLTEKMIAKIKKKLKKPNKGVVVAL